MLCAVVILSVLDKLLVEYPFPKIKLFLVKIDSWVFFHIKNLGLSVFVILELLLIRPLTITAENKTNGIPIFIAFLLVKIWDTIIAEIKMSPLLEPLMITSDKQSKVNRVLVSLLSENFKKQYANAGRK